MPALSSFSISLIFFCSPGGVQANGVDNWVNQVQPMVASVTVWAGLALLMAGVCVAGLLFLRRSRQPKEMAISKAAPGPSRLAEPAPRIPVTASKPKILEPLPPAQITLPTAAASVQPRKAPTPLPAKKMNGKPLRLNGHTSRRRKIFDYNRYFADLMSTVSGHTGILEGTGPVATPNHVPPTQATNSGPIQVSNGAFHANSELIASQTAFIEEQRRLIQEQTRVIEEKTKLIAEKNQLLKMQTEMIESKLL
jgi:hypothetical protein